ncbi:uncharacterized protein LOC110191365 [Drosophila serrata]|uniref:uncharacterized protein LOC110191365 n=1 Tax=Drosophila serrata TaxID=7274 RepID=UPI000A1D1038|nr:uncharacterized protein LOC110191365 [Drosophila serrata]
MVIFIFHVISILFTIAAAASNLKDINYDTPVNSIVNDLIENWESPFAYLKSRGYLSEDLPSAPDFQDFQQQLQGNLGKELALEKDSKRGLDKKENNCDSRALRSSDESEHDKLKDMFYNLFSSRTESASDELKSKLDVDWDMNALKYSARESAEKYVKALEETGKPKDQAEEPYLKKRQAQHPLRKEHLGQDHLLKQTVPFAHPKFSSGLPRALRSLRKAIRRSKMESQKKNHGNIFLEQTTGKSLSLKVN